MKLKAAATAATAMATRLFDLGPLEAALVVARPSKVIKSPYVADVLLLRDIDPAKLSEYKAQILRLQSAAPKGGAASPTKAQQKRDADEQRMAIQSYLETLTTTRHLAHAPSLDCAGTVVPGATVWLTPAASATAKTAYTIQLCSELRGAKGSDTVAVTVGYHPSLAERAFQALAEKDDEFLEKDLGLSRSDLLGTSSQKTFGSSRVDFVLETQDKLLLVEVKNVVGAEYEAGSVPSARSPIGVYPVPPGPRHAIFPHGTSTKSDLGVISDRAIKHIHELTELQGTASSSSSGKQIQSVVVFIVNREDCTAFRPCHEADAVFAQCLQKAQRKGVKLVAKELLWGLVSGSCSAGRSLPVAFDPSVDCDALDPALLQRVLTYNAEHANDRSYSPTKTAGAKRKRERETE